MILPVVLLPTDPQTPGPVPVGGDDAELARLGVELLEMALDLGGLIDPTPFCDGASAALAVSQGRWFDAALSGLGIIPYVGDLAKAGKFPRYLRTLDATAALLARSRRAADALRPALVRLEAALNWLPARGSVYLATVKQRVRALLPHGGRGVKSVPLPDVRHQFVFPPPVKAGDYIRVTAHGRLGVPGRVKVHRRSSTHRTLNENFGGDDAGHLFGARFGAPDEAQNLVAMNFKMNRGTFNHTVEAHWDDLLQAGTGVEASVTAVFRAADVKGAFHMGEARPIAWRAHWTEITPEGRRVPRSSNVTFMNPHTPQSRARQGIVSLFPEGHLADLLEFPPFPKLRPPGGPR
ncbi:MAG: DNA/RNA non-specific endonuclease [Gemmataceae bacterium]